MRQCRSTRQIREAIPLRFGRTAHRDSYAGECFTRASAQYRERPVRPSATICRPQHQRERPPEHIFLLVLEDITILAFEQAVSAPFCTRQLADLGARVIKIERPGEGDFARSYDTRVRGMASHFVWCNRSKESIALNLKHPGASDIL